jgi:inner membrane protein
MIPIQKSTSLTLKLVLICGLSIALVIPLLWISNTIAGREHYYQKSLDTFAESWAGSQTIVGPFLLVPYVDRTDKNQQIKHTIFFPADMDVKVKIQPEVRHRGIFEVVVYQAYLKIHGQFQNFLKSVQGDKEFYWNQSKLILHIADLKGIQSLTFLSQGHELPVQQGTDILSNNLKGVYTIPHIEPTLISDEKGLSFDVSLHLKGTDALNFLPIGKETHVKMESTWPDPSFSGHFLPLNRQISSDGFQATWHIPYLARSIPESFTSELVDLPKIIATDAFGVRLIKPANHYIQAERAIKYFYMFIAFTFIAFFLFEAVKKTQIHIFQYALTGCSLLCFFVLLTAFSEHLSFALAYFVASFAIVIQISLYTFKMIRELRERCSFVAIFIGLYGCLFVILHLEDYAFMIGSVGIFGVLSLTMYYTRNVNWFENETKALKISPNFNLAAQSTSEK